MDIGSRVVPQNIKTIGAYLIMSAFLIYFWLSFAGLDIGFALGELSNGAPAWVVLVWNLTYLCLPLLSIVSGLLILTMKRWTKWLSLFTLISGMTLSILLFLGFLITFGQSQGWAFDIFIMALPMSLFNGASIWYLVRENSV